MKKVVIILFLIPFISGSCKAKIHHLETGGHKKDTVVAAQNYNVATVSSNKTAVPKEDLSGKVITLTSSEFVARITAINNPNGFQYKGKTPCIVDCYADWCPPCRRLSPLIEDLAEQYKGKLIFYKINTDRARDICDAFDITSIPTLLFFKQNVQPAKIVGAPTKEELNSTIEQFLNN